MEDVVSESVETELAVSTELSGVMFAFAALDANPVQREPNFSAVKMFNR